MWCEGCPAARRRGNHSNPCKAGGEHGVGEALLAILLFTFPRTTMRPSRTDSSSDPQTAVLAISGMTCGSCVRHVHQALASLEGVHSAQVDRARDLARVAYDPAQVDPEQLVAAVNDAGYDARVTAS